MNEIEKKVMVAIQTAGIEVEDTMSEDIDLTELIEDSFQFISMIVNLEEELQVEIPDDYLVMDKLQSLKGFIVMLEELVRVEE